MMFAHPIILLLMRIVCAAEFEKAGIDLSKPLVVSCGSAMVAGMVAFTGHLLGKEVAVYDVSCYGDQLIAKYDYSIHSFTGEDVGLITT